MTIKTPSQKNIILYLGKINAKVIDGKSQLEEYTGNKYRLALLTDNKTVIDKHLEEGLDIVIRAPFKKMIKVEDALLPYEDEVVAITNIFDYMMPMYSRLVSLFPYIKNPTSRSLLISIDKVEMRKAIRKHAPKTVPRFMIVTDSKKETLDEIENQVNFPCVVKPASLSKSQLVATCYYREELEKTIKTTLQKIRRMYKEAQVEHEPKILVEQLMEGGVYSTDVYINSKGVLNYTPFIEIKTGKDIGHDDFFMYSQITPSNLNKNNIEAARSVVEDGVHAVGLRSCTAHVELYKTQEGFKIIEIGARVGGFRQELLSDAYGLKHYMNDMLIHLGKKPNLKQTKKKHTAFLKFWPKKAGVLKSIKGFKKMSEENYVIRSRQQKRPGEKVGLSKYGHGYICSFHIIGETRAELLGNIRKVEKAIDIVLE